MNSESNQRLANSLTLELQLTNRLIELSDRLKHSQMVSTDRKRDISSLKQDINDLRETIKSNLINTNFNNNFNAINETNIKQLLNSLRNSGIYSFKCHLIALKSVFFNCDLNFCSELGFWEMF